VIAGRRADVPTPAPTPRAGTKPAPGTRSQAAISKPKAARKVRHRGASS
jgi:hypothetical protein